MKKLLIFIQVILLSSVISFCMTSCGSDNDKEDIIPTSPIETFKKRLVGTWILKTYIKYETSGNKEIPVNGLTEQDINYYGLGNKLEVTFMEDNTFKYYQDDSKQKYDIGEWKKNWGDEYFDYKIYMINETSTWGNWDSVAKFLDDNTLYWLTHTNGYIYKRK